MAAGSTGARVSQRPQWCSARQNSHSSAQQHVIQSSISRVASRRAVVALLQAAAKLARPLIRERP